MPASATVLLSDSLQGDLSQWDNVGGAAEIVAAPGGGNAVTFDGLGTGGNTLYSNDTFSSSTGSFTLTFEFYANCGHPSGCGLFFWAGGGSPTVGGWLISDTPYNGIAQFPDEAAWQTVSYTFSGTSTQLAFEDYVSAPYAGTYPSSNAVYVRDVVLTDNSAGVAVGTVTVSDSSPIPEPGTLAMFGMALAGLFAGRGSLARRRSS